MCELFAFSGKREFEINDYLSEFYSHSDMHPHGWGLATMDGIEVQIEKETIQATKSNYLKERLAVPVRGKTVFAHIRYATIGNVERTNCHPYTKKDLSGRRWTMIHNGTIFDYPELNRYFKVQEGQTDSERILLHIVDLINDEIIGKGRELTDEERFNVLDNLVVSLSKGNKLNLILYDGEVLYVHTNQKDTLHYHKGEEEIVFSTHPLTDERWAKVPFTQLLAYREDTLVTRGTVHGNEYIETEEDLKFLYQIFSNL
jgi:glutamine amidotransferase